MSDDVPVPDEIKCSDQIFDVSFHPKVDALAVGLINGSVEVYKYEVEGESKSPLFCTLFQD